jgi:alpha-D-ribose 1-methylphosphonate 5-triphosphate synthase subunit PhnH
MNRPTEIALQDLAPGFQDPALDSQRVFRAVLQAMARPGQIQALDRLPEAPVPLGPATAALALTLFDLDTPIWLSDDLRGAAARYLAFHTGAPQVGAIGDARFIVIGRGAALPDLAAIDLGDAEYPERAATLLIQVERLAAASGRRLRGPGIAGHIDIAVEGLAADFWDAFALNRKRFPLGFDTLLVAGDALLGLPRSTILGEV